MGRLLHEPDVTTGEGLLASDARQAQLVAAAAAIRTWAYARRAMWTTVPLDIPVVVRAPAAATALAPPLTPVPAPVMPDAAPEIAAALPVAEAVPSLVARVIVSRPHIPAELLLRWVRRVSVAALLVAPVGGAAWAVRAYWPTLAAAWPARLTTPKTGTAVLESVPAGSIVLIDGRAVGTTPLTTELSAGRHVIEFRRRNVARRLDVEVVAGRSTVGRLDWAAKPTGRMRVTSVPEGARVTIDGRERGVTPVTVGDLSVGSHDLVLDSAAGSLRRTVTIRADRTVEIAEALYSGWLHVSSPIELSITDGARVVRLDERNQTLLSPGVHDLRFENRALGYRDVRQVEVKPGETADVSIVPPSSALTVTATESAEVFVDGERAGETPLTDHPVNLGTRDVAVRSASGVERRSTITVTVNPVRIDVDFAVP